MSRDCQIRCHAISEILPPIPGENSGMPNSYFKEVVEIGSFRTSMYKNNSA